jgi:RHS repeat-associated protein
VRIGEHAYYPFGAELTLTPHELPEELMKFTGHERDVQGNDAHTLDMMHARYEMATLGRFMSIDSHLDPSRAVGSPQIWNRYTYASNSPLRLVDPDGNEPLEFHKAVTKVFGKYMFNFDWEHGGLHIDISEYRRGNWVKLGRVAKNLEPLEEGAKIPKAAYRALLRNRGKLGAKAESALAQLLEEGGAAGAGRVLGKAIPVIGWILTIAIADKANADDDRETIKKITAEMEAYYHKPFDQISSDEITRFWREHDSDSMRPAGACVSGTPECR